MNNAVFKVPIPVNEPVRSYAPGTEERKRLKAALDAARNRVIEIPQYIGTEQVFSGNREKIRIPHDHQHVLGYFHRGSAADVEKAIDAALEAGRIWGKMDWTD